MSTMYYVLSKDQRRDNDIVKLRHHIVSDLLKNLCGVKNIYRCHCSTDYNRGYEYWLDTTYGIFHFELNKYDKEVRWNKKEQKCIATPGQNRVKLQGYSKNGYLIQLPNNIPEKFHTYFTKKLLGIKLPECKFVLQYPYHLGPRPETTIN